MKKIYLILLLLEFASCKNQPNKGNDSTGNKTVSITEIDESNPLNYNYIYPNNLLPEKISEFGYEFYPIGFSPEGHLGYIYRQQNGGCGNCKHEIVIQNLLSDKVETRYDISTESFDDRKYLKDWRNDFRNIRKILISKGISQTEVLLESNKVFYDKSGIHKYEVRITKKESFDPNLDYGGKVLSYDVYVNFDGIKTKKISFGVITEAIDLEYLGIIRSPFDEQLAIVLNQKSYGYEAEITNNITIVGCNLDPKYFR